MSYGQRYASLAAYAGVARATAGEADSKFVAMKLDSRAMRHLASEDWNVLLAVERGSRDHEIVPTTLIERFSRTKGGVQRSISTLAKNGLIARVKEAKYDGYRLTYGGIDYLALHHYSQKKEIYSVGSRVGVGKESDITMVADDKGVQKILKIHRLGRISFRTVKSNRDYLKKKQGGSWMYLSKLAAMKEFAFMQVLKEEGFNVPEPIAQSRHTVLMSFIDSYPLRQIQAIPDPASLYGDLMGEIMHFAKHGLIHGDFNEFNILIKEHVSKETNEAGEEEETIALEPVIIDFPQMLSMDHENAEMYFDRDVECVKRFFLKRFHFTSSEPGPFFKDAKKTVGQDGARRLDAAAEATGFTKKMAKDLEKAIREEEAKKLEKQAAGGRHSDDDDDDENEDEDRDEDDLEDDETPADEAQPQEKLETTDEKVQVDSQQLSQLKIADTS
ncbi:serine/threonine-protein kinase RIO2 [Plectosphaerella cucumerina]|uniref:Serine/threonine-protein kinase RIO2 n=1 Tax=Plectosphaerella cucumerina TaxID=40658 RepID=A0A8K0WZJ8_9PEZI|nr:serine/threonine-protein kinase RIO2 [Plectosphaerella cucumerina]